MTKQNDQIRSGRSNTGLKKGEKLDNENEDKVKAKDKLQWRSGRPQDFKGCSSDSVAG